MTADEFSDLLPAQATAATPQSAPVQPVMAAVGPQGYTYPAGAANAGQPIPQAQVQGYRGLEIDRTKPYGSVTNPMVDAPGRMGPSPTDYHVTTDGDFVAPTDMGEFHDLVPQRSDDSLGFVKGLSKVGDNIGSGVQWGLEHLGVPVTSALHSAGLTTPEEDAQAHTNMMAQYSGRGINPSKAGEFAGNVAGTLPFLEAGPIAGGIAGGLALSDAKEPLGLARDGVIGGIGGKVGDVIGRGVVNTVAPKISSGVQALLDAGVPLTSGMIAGGKGALGRFEALAQNIPLAGELVRKRGNEALEGFARATPDVALAPTGMTVSTGGETGHDVYNAAKAAMGRAYDAAGGGATVPLDRTFVDQMSALRDKATALPDDLQKRFDYVMNREVLGRIKSVSSAPVGGSQVALPGSATPTSGMTADSLSDAKVGLNKEIAGYKGKPGWEGDYAQHLIEARDGLKDMLGRSSPEARIALDAADSAFPGFKAYEGAVKNSTQNSTTPNGFFTPQQLQASINAGATTGARAGNSVPLADWAEAGKEILPRKYKDVVSPMQSFIEGGVGAGVVGTDVLGGHGAGAALAIPSALASPLYTKPVQDALRAGLQRTSAGRAALERVLGPLDNMASVPAASVGTNVASRFPRLLAPPPSANPR